MNFTYNSLISFIKQKRLFRSEWFDESGLDSAAICVQSMEQNCTKSYSQLDISNILL